ncbi:hypothetical protein QFC20_006103 [Naganishia adeliensis]|uniref:Uncharacterized protein n=1 Tax=Naganishia adeliensis TaxID=92952 RepID=A0ACC2VFK8_9TREE|nr:hypothetical protein QFC20_006103 [Naganishia adeliensis]
MGSTPRKPRKLPKGIFAGTVKPKGAPKKLDKLRAAFDKLTKTVKRTIKGSSDPDYDPEKVRESDDPLQVLEQHRLRVESSAEQNKADVFLTGLMRDNANPRQPHLSWIPKLPGVRVALIQEIDKRGWKIVALNILTTYLLEWFDSQVRRHGQAILQVTDRRTSPGFERDLTGRIIEPPEFEDEERFQNPGRYVMRTEFYCCTTHLPEDWGTLVPGDDDSAEGSQDGHEHSGTDDDNPDLATLRKKHNSALKERIGGGSRQCEGVQEEGDAGQGDEDEDEDEDEVEVEDEEDKEEGEEKEEADDDGSGRDATRKNTPKCTIRLVPFLAGISGQNALDSAILNMQNGIALDSSWRALNHHGCPLTAVVTYNENHRMIPVCSFLSQDVRTQTLSQLLLSLKETIERRAQAIVEAGDNASFEGIRSADDVAVIKTHAKIIVDAGQWSPPTVMIDKDLKERKAIEEGELIP